VAQKNCVISPARQRELQQRDISALFAFTVTSIEGSFQKARVLRRLSNSIIIGAVRCTALIMRGFKMHTSSVELFS